MLLLYYDPFTEELFIVRSGITLNCSRVFRSDVREYNPLTVEFCWGKVVALVTGTANALQSTSSHVARSSYNSRGVS